MSFDLHFHPTTKSFLEANKPAARGSAWDCLNAGKIVPIDEVEGLTDDRLDSQSSLTQVCRGGMQLGIASIHAVEPDFMKPFEMGLIGLLTTLNHRLVRRIKKRQYTSYRYIHDELEHLIKASKETRGPYSMVFARTKADLEKDQLNLLVSIEGGHCFLEEEVPTAMNYADDALAQVICQRFEAFVDKYDSTVTFTFLTITHIANGPLCAHAFAFAKKRVKPARKNSQLFFSQGPKGIRKVGHRIIEAALSRNVLLDVKHASYYSRLQYYEKLKLEYPDRQVPIIASHVGAAGYSFMEMREEWKVSRMHLGARYVKVYREFGIEGARFYPLSLNLFDEEIRLIVESGGLIGVSLDERISGSKSTSKPDQRNHEADYIHHEEYDFLVGDGYLELNEQLFTAPRTVNYPSKMHGDVRYQSTTARHLLHLCNNILRFVYAGGPTTWKHLCLGSDFDGMIDAVDVCKTYESVDELSGKLKAELEYLLLKMSDGDVLFYVDKNNLRADLSNKVDDLMLHNGKRFVEQHFLV